MRLVLMPPYQAAPSGGGGTGTLLLSGRGRTASTTSMLDATGNGHTLTGSGTLVTGAAPDGSTVFQVGSTALNRVDSLGLTGTDPRTYMILCRLTGGTADRQPLMGQGVNGSSRSYMFFEANTFNSAGNRFGLYVEGNSFDSGTATDTAWHLHTLVVSSMTLGASVSGNIQYYIGHTLQSLGSVSGTNTWPGAVTLTSVTLGALSDNLFTAPIQIAEARVYGAALTDAERLAAWAELEAIYGTLS